VAEHPKGPWTLGKKEDGYVDIDALQGRVPHRGLARVVWCLEGAQYSPSMEANAHLIAAAPDMAEALIEARTQISLLQKMKGIIDPGCGTLSIIDAALAKAGVKVEMEDAGQ
jgi:hypothetical protein